MQTDLRRWMMLVEAEIAQQSRNLLVVVHPGSCCGSADFNIGHKDAEIGRAKIIDDLDQWDGDVAIIDGELSDELPSYPQFDHALLATHIITRVWDDDPTRGARKLIRRLKLDGRWSISLTGAWAEDCVACAANVFIQAGIPTTVLDSAMRIS